MVLVNGTYEVGIHVTLERLCCGQCGLDWAVNKRWLDDRRADGIGFWCPNGHGSVYRETEETRLKKRLEQSERWAREASEALTAERKSHSVTKGKATKLRNCAERGVCSDCNRTFANYAKHQADVHGVENGWARKV